MLSPGPSPPGCLRAHLGVFVLATRGAAADGAGDSSAVKGNTVAAVERSQVLGGGVPLVGPQEELRGPSGYTPRDPSFISSLAGGKVGIFEFYNNKQMNKQTTTKKPRASSVSRDTINQTKKSYSVAEDATCVGLA